MSQYKMRVQVSATRAEQLLVELQFQTRDDGPWLRLDSYMTVDLSRIPNHNMNHWPESVWPQLFIQDKVNLPDPEPVAIPKPSMNVWERLEGIEFFEQLCTNAMHERFDGDTGCKVPSVIDECISSVERVEQAANLGS